MRRTIELREEVVISGYLLAGSADEIGDGSNGKWFATALVDLRPERVSSAWVGGITRSVSQKAPRISPGLDKAVDDSRDCDRFRGMCERESALRASSAFQNSGLDQRVESLAHVVARGARGIGHNLGAERLSVVLAGKHDDCANSVVGGL
jgi:hypothetical protein